MELDRPDIPRYIALANMLRRRILSGEIPPTHPMPSTRTLHQEYGVAVNTVVKAYALLKSEHLVRSVPGLGLFPTFPEDRPERP